MIAGYELLQAYARVFERVSYAVGRAELGAFLSLASGGQPSTASLEFFRRDLSTGAFTVKAGTVVRASASLRDFVVVADVAFGVSDYYVGALAQSRGLGEEYDVPGPVVTPDGTRLPGEIDTIVTPILLPIFAEPNLEVRQVADAWGGSAPILDQLGADRGIDRLPNEGDTPYRARALKLPDAVSPDAVRRHLTAIFAPLNIPFDLVETWEHRFMSCWDAPDATVVHPTQGTMRAAEWCWDDPRTDRTAPRWMTVDDLPAGYVLVLPRLPAFRERAMVWDDPALDATGWRRNFGLRAVGAWDDGGLDGPTHLVGCWDGYDAAHGALVTAVTNLLEQVKGGSVGVDLLTAEADDLTLRVAVSYPPLP